MKKNTLILIFLFGVSLWFFSGCSTAVDENQEREEQVSDLLHKMDSVDTEALLDSLAAETDSIREALDLERNQQNAPDNH
ncbi:MAG: hypothetical protein R3D00_23495 [Bacteroidia bacterium]